MNVQELYYILKKTKIDVSKFLEEVKFCSFNENINILLEHNLKMLSVGEGQIINKIYNTDIIGDLFVIIEKKSELFVYSCLDRNEMIEIKKMFDEDMEIKNLVLIERGKILEGFHKKSNLKSTVVKDAEIKEIY